MNANAIAISDADFSHDICRKCGAAVPYENTCDVCSRGPCCCWHPHTITLPATPRQLRAERRDERRELRKSKENVARALVATLRLSRENNRLTQGDLAARTGFSVAAISAFEVGRRPLRLLDAIRLADALGFELTIQRKAVR